MFYFKETLLKKEFRRLDGMLILDVIIPDIRSRMFNKKDLKNCHEIFFCAYICIMWPQNVRVVNYLYDNLTS